MLVSAGIGAATGFTAQYNGASYPQAVFVSYATSELLDRTIQHALPRTRSLTPDSRTPLAFAVETLVVSSVAGLSAAALQHQMEPFTHTLLGRATPGVIGIGAGALFPRAIIRAAMSLGVNLVTNATRGGLAGMRMLAGLRKRRDEARGTEQKADDNVLR